jgi:uncharacterized protein (DUF1697 family)
VTKQSEFPPGWDEARVERVLEQDENQSDEAAAPRPVMPLGCSTERHQRDGLRGEAYVILMRGINVGGKNKIPMAELRLRLEELGFGDVATYIQSGNVILCSELDAVAVSAAIEAMLPTKFQLERAIVKVVAFDHGTFANIVAQAPEDFGDDSTSFRYNVLFPMDYSLSEAMRQIDVREGVDAVWQGEHAIYFRNSALNASKSRLSRIAQQPMYQFITIRNWNTTTKLLRLLEERVG